MRREIRRMARYSHRPHAGNIGDTLKHAVWAILLSCAREQSRSHLVVDTHAGEGLYDLVSNSRAGAARIQTAVDLLWKRSDWPETLAAYREAIHTTSSDAAPQLRAYPGSPRITQLLLGERGRAIVTEIDPISHGILASRLAGDQRFQVLNEDGLALLPRLEAPLSEPLYTLIDPPYCDHSEAARAVMAIEGTLAYRPGATIALWYPLRDRRGAPSPLFTTAKRVSAASLVTELWTAPLGARAGMIGAGMWIVNPPATLIRRLHIAVPWLWGALDPNRRGGWSTRMMSAHGKPAETEAAPGL